MNSTINELINWTEIESCKQHLDVIQAMQKDHSHTIKKRDRKNLYIPQRIIYKQITLSDYNGIKCEINNRKQSPNNYSFRNLKISNYIIHGSKNNHNEN